VFQAPVWRREIEMNKMKTHHDSGLMAIGLLAMLSWIGALALEASPYITEDPTTVSAPAPDDEAAGGG
jgi:hypothetical protein